MAYHQITLTPSEMKSRPVLSGDCARTHSSRSCPVSPPGARQACTGRCCDGHTGWKHHRLASGHLQLKHLARLHSRGSAGLAFPWVVRERHFSMCYLPPQILLSLYSASTKSQTAKSSLEKSSISMNTFSASSSASFSKMLKKMQFPSGQNFSQYHTHFSKQEKVKFPRGKEGAKGDRS